jgi:hypothetical protein
MALFPQYPDSSTSSLSLSGSTSLPSTSLREGEQSRTLTTLSLCFDSAQHPEFIEGSKGEVEGSMSFCGLKPIGVWELHFIPRPKGSVEKVVLECKSLLLRFFEIKMLLYPNNLIF